MQALIDRPRLMIICFCTCRDDGVAIVQTYTFDFFNYAGIHRSVHLYTTPLTYIEEMEITTDLSKDNNGMYK